MRTNLFFENMVRFRFFVDKPVNQGDCQVKGEIEQKLSPNTLPETCPPSEKFSCYLLFAFVLRKGKCF